MLWIRGMAQKAIHIAANWASKQVLQFSSRKTEMVLFTHKRCKAIRCYSGQQVNLETTHYPITRKATTALMQCRQIVGKTWGIKPFMMEWIYTAMIHPIMSYACVPWASGLNMYLEWKLTKVRRIACLMVSSAFFGTPTGAFKILLNITPVEEFLLAEAVRGSFRITVCGLWRANPVGSLGKAKTHVDVCNEARRFLPLLLM